jgi:hypothetical protein
MKLKTMVLLVVVCAAAVATLWYLQRQPAPANNGLPLGDKVLRFFPVNEISKVVIRAAEGSVTLEQNQDHLWVVREYYGYPAQFGKLADLLKTLYGMTVGQTVRVRPSSLGQLKLLAPDEQGSPAEKATQIQCYNNSGESVAIIWIGNAKRGEAREDSPYGFAMPEGTFVRLPGNPADLRDTRAQVILVKDTFQLDETPAAWIDKQLFAVPNENVQRIAVTTPQGEQYCVARTNTMDQLALAALAPTQQVKAASLAALGNALTAFVVDDVVAPAAARTNTALAAAWTFAATTFDGVSYTVKLADTNAPQAYAQVTIKYTKPVIDSVASNIAAHIAAQPGEIEESVRVLDRKLAQWMFVLPEYKANQLRLPKAGLLEPAPAPPAAAPVEPPKTEHRTPKTS